MGLVTSGVNQAFNQARSALGTAFKAGSRAAGEVSVVAVQANIDESGARGGNERWPDVPEYWLRQRVTWPSSPQLFQAYIDAHKPLIDTGAGRDSIFYADKEESNGNIEGETGPGKPYMVDQAGGVPGKIRARPYGFVTDDDLPALTDAFKSAVSESLR